jgi:periplasmic protein TonB
MFENTLIPDRRTRPALSLGYVLEVVLLALLALIPLIHVQALPASLLRSVILPLPPARLEPRVTAVHTVRRPSLSEIMSAPVRIPAAILPSRPEPPSSDMLADGPPGAVPWGNGIPGGFGESALPPPPQPAAKTPPASRITLGGVVEAARLIYEVRPEYPAIARNARVQGTVRLEAVIGKDGSVKSLHAVSGPPLLIPFALRAVAEWRYQPTLLNGTAVEVATEIDVNFVLNE